MAEPIQGAKELQARMQSISRRFPQEAATALYQEALVEMRESMRRTPVDTGELRASHETTKPDGIGGPFGIGRDIRVEIHVGGPAAPYALIVHEDLEADHPVGQAKFLESTLRESAPHLAARVAKRFDLNRAAGR